MSNAAVYVSVAIAPPLLPVYEQPLVPGPGYIWTAGLLGLGSGRVLLGAWHMGAGSVRRRAVDSGLLGLGERLRTSGIPGIGAVIAASMAVSTTDSACRLRVSGRALGSRVLLVQPCSEQRQCDERYQYVQHYRRQQFVGEARQLQRRFRRCDRTTDASGPNCRPRGAYTVVTQLKRGTSWPRVPIVHCSPGEQRSSGGLRRHHDPSASQSRAGVRTEFLATSCRTPPWRVTAEQQQRHRPESACQ